MADTKTVRNKKQRGNNMINSTHKQAKQAALGTIQDKAYLYTKTGLFEHLEAYFEAINEGYRVGIKPEELPYVNTLKLEKENE